MTQSLRGSSTQWLLGHFDPVPSPDLSIVESDSPVRWIPFRELGANRGAELVRPAVAAGTLGTFGDRPDDAYFVSQVDDESSNILDAPAGILLDDGQRPRSGCIGRVAKPIARPPGGDALLVAYPLTHAGRIDVAGFDRE
jgi:hypothetical protein